MKWRIVLCIVISLFMLSAFAYTPGQDAAVGSQPGPSAPKPPKPQFFAGVVMEADASHIKVTRDLVGRPTETRVFALDVKTKTPKGGIKPKTRVTVRYQHLAAQDLALEIQVRPLKGAPKST